MEAATAAAAEEEEGGLTRDGDARRFAQSVGRKRRRCRCRGGRWRKGRQEFRFENFDFEARIPKYNVYTWRVHIGIVANGGTDSTS